MEDINDRLERLLNDPDIEQKLSKALAGLGIQSDGTGDAAAPTQDAPPPEMPDLSAIMGLLSAGSGEGQDLLRALAPYLRPSRRKKIEEAERLMTVCRLLPVLTAGTKEKRDAETDRG